MCFSLLPRQKIIKNNMLQKYLKVIEEAEYRLQNKPSIKYYIDNVETDKETFEKAEGDFVLYLDDYNANKIPFFKFFGGENEVKKNVPFFMDEVLEETPLTKALIGSDEKAHFSWRPNKETESNLNTKPVHSNPWNDESYCPRKKRLEDAAKEAANWNLYKPPAPKQKDKVTTEDLKPSEVFPNLSKSHLEKGEIKNIGVKDNQKEPKAPIFTFCNQMKNAIESLAFRSLYGHERYKAFDEDWQNFSRVPNGDFEYSNAEFRHALGIGADEDEEQHLVAAAWNSIARLEIFLREKRK